MKPFLPFLLLAAAAFAKPIEGSYAGSMTVTMSDASGIISTNVQHVNATIAAGQIILCGPPRFGGTLSWSRDKFSGTIDDFGTTNLSDGANGPYLSNARITGPNIIFGFPVPAGAEDQTVVFRLHLVKKAVPAAH